jgi:hypothetical protein
VIAMSDMTGEQPLAVTAVTARIRATLILLVRRDICTPFAFVV